jgi:hypothetical protein
MSQKTDTTVERILDSFQNVIDLGKERRNPSLILAAAMAQARLVGLLNESAEEMANAVECLIAENIQRLPSAERSQLIALLRDKVDHIEREFCS